MENAELFFGLWWTPNNPLMESYEKNSEADWEPYYLQELADKNVYEPSGIINMW